MQTKSKQLGVLVDAWAQRQVAPRFLTPHIFSGPMIGRERPGFLETAPLLPKAELQDGVLNVKRAPSPSPAQEGRGRRSRVEGGFR